MREGGVLISTSEKCLICSRPLTLHEKFSGQICSGWRCRARQLDDALQAARAATARDIGFEPAASFPIIVVPWRAFRVVELSADLRDELVAFLAHLLVAAPQTLDESIAQKDADSGVGQFDASGHIDSQPDRLLAKICAVCQGFCCFYGATRHAFLDREALLRFRNRTPELPADGVIAEYLRYLPECHGEASCVYHAETGCALPRDMRANICNRYECHGLTAARRVYAGSAQANACVVVRHDNRIVSCAFVEASGASTSNVAA